MPKRLLIALMIAACTIAAAACHGSTSPTPTLPPSSPTPDPKITKATIKVTIHGTAQPGIPVDESTPTSTSSPRPGKTFETHTTGKRGLAVFKHLKPAKTYCWVAKLAPGQTSSECAAWFTWQSGTITLGT